MKDTSPGNLNKGTKKREQRTSNHLQDLRGLFDQGEVNMKNQRVLSLSNVLQVRKPYQLL